MNSYQSVRHFLATGLFGCAVLFSGTAQGYTYYLPQDGEEQAFSSCQNNNNIVINCPGSIALRHIYPTEIILTRNVTITIAGDFSVEQMNVEINLANTYNLSIVVSGDVEISRGVTLNANLFATGNIHFDRSAEVSGRVQAGGNIVFDGYATIQAEVSAGGNLEVGSFTDIYGDLSATGNMDIGAFADIYADLVAGGDLNLGGQSDVADNSSCTATGGNYLDYCATFIEYRFDENSWSGASGEVIDSSIKNRHGTAFGSSQTIAPGYICRAGQFNGTTDYVRAPSLSPLQGTGSLSFWIRTTSTGNNNAGQAPAIAGVNSSGSSNDIFWGWIDARGRIGITKGTFTGTKSMAVINDGTFRHVVLTRNASTGDFQIFIDGEPDRTGRRTSLRGTVSNSFRDIGRVSGSAAPYFAGDLDEVMVFDKVLNANEAKRLYLSQREQRNGGEDPRCVAPELDHLRLTHPSAGITCLPASLQLSACEDSSCSALYTGEVTAALTPSGSNSHWSGQGVASNQVTFSGGTVELELQHTTPEGVTLSAVGTGSTPEPENPLVCTTGGSVSDCTMTFAEAGFDVSVPNLTANRPDGPVTLRAVKSDPNNPLTCASALSGTRSVRLWSDFANPATGTESVSLAGTTINSASPGTALTLTFDANAEATISSIHYPDAGQIRLNARYEGSGDDAGLELEGSELFVSKPAGFVLTPEGSCPDADATCTSTHHAGDAFNLKIEAKAWESDIDTDLSDNPATPNYRQTGIALSHRLVAPAGGVAGDLDVTEYDHGLTSNGTVTITQELSEVGVFEIDMIPPSYFGQDLGEHTSAFTARMTPADFVVSETTGSLAPHCPGPPPFAYSGRPLNWQVAPELEIEAVNADGATTTNYTLGGFNKLSNSSLVRIAPSADLAALTTSGDPFPVSSTLNPGTLTVTASGRQRYLFASGDEFTFQKTVDSRVTPFFPQLAINLASLTDADSVEANALPTDLTPLANFDLRYGRIRLENSFGPETRALIVPMHAEYYDGTQMVVNEAESCWVYSDTDATLSSTLTSLQPVTGTLVAGEVSPGSELVLDAPGAGNTGSVDLRLTVVPLWLQDDFNGDAALTSPEATATFGVYRGHDRIIYWREIER